MLTLQIRKDANKCVAQPAGVDMMGASTQQRRETQMLEAHYTTGKQPLLDFMHRFQDGARVVLETVPVSGKREARKLAVARGATPWNF
jgi:hypothetical protein